MANFPWEPVDQGRPASDGGPASQSDDAKVLRHETATAPSRGAGAH
jgi:hypothetical protein